MAAPGRSTGLLLAALLAGAASLAAFGLCSQGGRLLTTLDWTLYDNWAARATDASLPSLVVVTIDEPLATGRTAAVWDRAMAARVISALTLADAAAIGLDEYLTTPSGPEHGGASSDALLLSAIAESERVVVPAPLLAYGPGTEVSRAAAPVTLGGHHPSWWPADTASTGLLRATPVAPLLPSVMESAAAVTQQVATPDVDGQLRRLPLAVRIGDGLVPAFGLSLFLRSLGVSTDQLEFQPGHHLARRASASGGDPGKGLSIPLDTRGDLLVPTLHRAIPALPALGLNSLVQAVQQKEHERIRSWVEHRIVLLPPTVASQTGIPPQTPAGQQAALIRALADQQWATSFPTGWSLLLAWALATVGVWCGLTWRNWLGVGCVSLTVILLLALAYLGLLWFRIAVPLAPLLFTIVLAGLGTLLWNHAAAAARLVALEGDVLRVQGELASVREALIYQESTVEQLEEDLDAARSAGARATNREQSLAASAADVQRELEEARGREADTRRRLATLEQELAGLRAVSASHGPLPEAELETLRSDCERFGIVTREPGLLRTFRDLKKGASSTLPVLILGESGTGKELFARAVHQLSPRQAQPFIAVNMAAVSPELFESELFGHVRGAFTGAHQDRAGYFELAARGTIFLDEIGDLRPEHQAKLLRVLQEKSFYRVGASRPTTVDVRVVAATNKDLQRGIAEGWFREDLYARLKGLLVTLPPLRQRQEDLPVLAEHFVRQAAQRLARPTPSVTEDLLATLRRYPWPHNLRELSQCLEQAVTLTDGAILTAADLRLPGVAQLALGVGGTSASGVVDLAGDQAVLACLRQQGFDMQATARTLGWDRSTVTQRLKGLCFQTLVETHGDRAKAALRLAQDPALVRTVELKLMEYVDHLMAVVSAHQTQSDAMAACRKRFKNLPDRHFKAVETLIAKRFQQAPSTGSIQSRSS